MKRGAEWATWVGRAALAQRNPDYLPDHTLPQPRRGKLRDKKTTQPRVPDQARVIRRFPWASRSLGTIEFTEDLHDELDEEYAPSTSQAVSVLQRWRSTPFNDNAAEVRVRRVYARV